MSDEEFKPTTAVLLGQLLVKVDDIKATISATSISNEKYQTETNARLHRLETWRNVFAGAGFVLLGFWEVIRTKFFQVMGGSSTP